MKTSLRILLDQNMPRQLIGLLPAHQVTAAIERGWARLENGALLSAAEAASFELLLTGDQRIRYQQNLQTRQIALVVLSTNNWNHIRAQSSLLTAATSRAKPGSYEEVTFQRPPLPRRPFPSP